MKIISIVLEQNEIGVSTFTLPSTKIKCYQLNIIPKERNELFKILIDIDNIETLLVPANLNYELIQYIRDKYQEQRGNGLYVQRVLNAECTLESSIAKLLDLNYNNFPFENQNVSENQPNLIDNNLSEIDLPRYDILSQVIDLGKKIMVRSLGGLLCYLINNQKINRSYDIQNIIFDKNINDLVHINEQTINYLSIFKDDIHPSMIKGKGQTKEGFSLYMLFQKFIHTKQGQLKLKHLFLSPTFNLELLKRRNQSVNFFYSQSTENLKIIQQNLSKCSNLNKTINKLRDFSMNFNDWYSLKTTLQCSLKLMFHILGQIKGNIHQGSFLFQEHLSERTLQELSQLNQFLDNYLEFSQQEGEITIRAGIVPELDELVKIYENLEEILNYYTEQELRRLQEQNPNFQSQMIIQYFPQLGFFITIEKQIPLGNNSLIACSNQLNNPFKGNENSNSRRREQNSTCFQEGDLENYSSDIGSLQKKYQNEFSNSLENSSPLTDSLQYGEESEIHSNEYFQYKQNEGIYNSTFKIQYGLSEDYLFCFSLQDALLFKNDLAIQLDEKYGDIQSRIIDIQRDILREVELQILNYSDELIEVNSFIGDLDLYFCLYSAAEAYCLRKPQLVEESTLIVYGMRNILTEISVGEKQFVTNNFCVYNYQDCEVDRNITTKGILNNEYSNRFTFITGPNYSGKSVLLKSVGMVCYLAHIGSFVPCRFAKIGMMDGIYVTTSQHDSVLNFTGQSAQQLLTINHILYQATNKSLLLIDEFGKNLRLKDSLKINYSLIKCLTEDNYQSRSEIENLSDEFQRVTMFDEIVSSSSLMEPFEKINQINNSILTSEQVKNQTLFQNNYRQQYYKVPITLMASHLNQLLNFSDFKENYILRLTHMEVLIEDGRNIYKVSELKKDLNSLQKIVHVYKFKQGASLTSCAALVTKNIVGNHEILISRIFEIQRSILNGELKINPRQNLEIIHLQKVQRVVELLTKNSTVD